MKITFTGDSLFSSRQFAKRLDHQILDLLASSDGAFTNAEFSTPNHETAPAAGRGYVTAVRPDHLDEFNDLHFNLVNFANNHTGDFGTDGILDTIHETEKRGIEPLGLGRSLDEAQKAHFIDTAQGRIGIVAASATRAEVFLASNAGNGVPARPGLNPLRWSQTYVLTPEQFAALQQIDASLGTAASAAIGTRIERWQPQDADHFQFGSMFEQKLLIEKGTKPHVKTTANPDDLAAITKQIQDAKKRSDFVIYSVHTHEGVAENWYADEPAEFIQQAAHAGIDAGADIFIGHGAHFLRGIELYHGKPIFYNLGSFLMEFEAGESIIPPEMYASYGFEPGATPSDLHQSRAYDEKGDFAGFNADELFSEGVILTLDVAKGEYQLQPIDLRMSDANALHRGIPAIADPAFGAKIIQRLSRLSAAFGTQLHYDSESQIVSLTANEV
jgi:poly-gamma-glutamate synthesis protein (capsule biosynthesis protein)